MLFHRGDNGDVIEVGFRIWGRARKRNGGGEGGVTYSRRGCKVRAGRLLVWEDDKRGDGTARNVVRLPRVGLPLF